MLDRFRLEGPKLDLKAKEEFGKPRRYFETEAARFQRELQAWMHEIWENAQKKSSIMSETEIKAMQAEKQVKKTHQALINIHKLRNVMRRKALEANSTQLSSMAKLIEKTIFSRGMMLERALGQRTAVRQKAMEEIGKLLCFL